MIIDAHAHLRENMAVNEHFLKECHRLGIDKICAFCTSPPASTPSNEITKKMMDQYPESVIGFAFVNPSEGEKAVNDFEMCIKDLGMRGLKLLLDRKATDPAVFPIIEKSIELRVPVLMHTFMHRGIMNERNKVYPNESGATEIAELARRYPQAMIIMAHYSLGDWEYGVKAVKGCENVYLDTSGTGIDLGSVEMAVKGVGARRVVFGTDNVILPALGKVYGAMISEEERTLILIENMIRLLKHRGPV